MNFEKLKRKYEMKLITEDQMEEIEQCENIYIVNNGYSGFVIDCMWYSIINIVNDEKIGEFTVYLR
mgnify:FL=1